MGKKPYVFLSVNLLLTIILFLTHIVSNSKFCRNVKSAATSQNCRQHNNRLCYGSGEFVCVILESSSVTFTFCLSWFGFQSLSLFVLSWLLWFQSLSLFVLSWLLWFSVTFTFCLSWFGFQSISLFVLSWLLWFSVAFTFCFELVTMVFSHFHFLFWVGYYGFQSLSLFVWVGYYGFQSLSLFVCVGYYGFQSSVLPVHRDKLTREGNGPWLVHLLYLWH